MDIKVKEPLYILSNNREYVVRAGTSGVERNRVFFFYDTTRTSAVGFSRDHCIENTQTFQVSRNLSDKEISQRDVFKILDSYERKECNLAEVYERIKSL